MVLVHDTSSYRGLQVYQVSLKNLKRFSSYQREITPKIHIVSSWFTSVPSFIEKSLTVFKLYSGHENVSKIIKGK